MVLRERHFQLAFVANKSLSLHTVPQKNCFAFCLTEVLATNPVNKNCLVIASSTGTLGFHFAEGPATYWNWNLACFCRGGRRAAMPHGTWNCYHTRAIYVQFTSLQVKWYFNANINIVCWFFFFPQSSINYTGTLQP